jgi:hypothetical protein
MARWLNAVHYFEFSTLLKGFPDEMGNAGLL